MCRREPETRDVLASALLCVCCVGCAGAARGISVGKGTQPGLDGDVSLLGRWAPCGVLCAFVR